MSAKAPGPTIVHLTARATWEAARAAGSYTADSLATEGFIHCSTRAQVLGVANQRFRGRVDMVLLWIDAARVVPPIRYENFEGGTERFPHVYGPLNVDAVTAVTDFRPDAAGEFSEDQLVR